MIYVYIYIYIIQLIKFITEITCTATFFYQIKMTKILISLNLSCGFALNFLH